jgi:hypothetical protein
MVVAITVRGPVWFFGIDSLFEGFAAVALLLVTLFSLKAYRFTKDRRYRTFAIGFGLMALGMASRALADLAVYAEFNVPVRWLMVGYAAYMGLTLVSLVVLFALTLNAKQRAPLVALLGVTMAGLVLSASYRLSFHSFSLVLLFFIAWHFMRNAQKKKTMTAILVCASFALLALAQVAFVIDILRRQFYVVGHVVHLVAFALLFIALLRVLKLR